MRNTLSICLFCVTVLSVSSGQQVLNGIEGDTVTFPAAVRNMGTFSFNGDVIGDVIDSEATLNTDKSFTDRLQWNSSTGFFSIADLKMEDSGEYRVQNNDGGQPKPSVYKLTVFSKIEELKGEISELKGEIGKLIGEDSRFDDEIEELKKKDTHFKGEDSRFDDEVEELKKKDTHFKEKDNALTTGLVGIFLVCFFAALGFGFVIRRQSQRLRKIRDEIRELKDQDDVLKGKIGELGGEIGGLKALFYQQVLSGAEEKTVIFDTKVKTMGAFSFNSTVIGAVSNGQGTLNLDKRFTGRLQWDRSTGLFSITGLKKEDSGEYRVQNNDEGQPNLSVYKLTVSTVAGQKVLQVTVGEKVTFPDAVKNMGDFSFKGAVIGHVTDGQGTLNIDKRFTGRLKWDRSTGLFSITDLKEGDFGMYTVQSNDEGQPKLSEYILIVSNQNEDLKGVSGIEDGESSKMMRQEGVMDTEM